MFKNIWMTNTSNPRLISSSNIRKCYHYYSKASLNVINVFSNFIYSFNCIDVTFVGLHLQYLAAPYVFELLSEVDAKVIIDNFS